MLDAMHTGFKICFQSKTSLSCFSVGIHDLKKQKQKKKPSCDAGTICIMPHSSALA